MSGNPAGKPKGTPNKITVTLREAILAAGEAAGGEGGLTAYLTRLALENSSAYSGLLAKVLPTTLTAPESDGGETKITFQRVIVYPDGHKHIEGVTANQLPAPASHVLPGSDRRVSNSDDSDDKSDT